MKKLLDLDRPVQLRSGEPARILCRDAAGPYPVIALVRRLGLDSPQSFTLGGSLYEESRLERDSDLINRPAVFKVAVWIAINKYGSACFGTEPPPREGMRWQAVKKIEVDIVEGEGL